jgi:hypothetical protein
VRTRLLVVAALAVGVLLAPAAADAKSFRPGDLQVCNAKVCVAVSDQAVLNAFSRLFYGRPSPAEAPAPRLGKRYFQIRFSNGYVTGIVAMDHLDRFLSYGVNHGQFGAGKWYRVPATAAAGLRALTHGLQPLHLNRSIIWSASR